MGIVWEDQLPVIGMVAMEVILALMTVLNKQALSHGISSRILVFYRQSCATLVIFPIAYLSRKESCNARMDFRLFLLIFMASFIGVTMFENLYVPGLHLTTSSVTSSMFNLVPVLTFLMAIILGLEKVKLKKLSSIAKIIGTISCVGGAIAISFLKGEKLLNDNAQALLGTHNWLLGCLLLFLGVSCLSSWLILQVPITKRYPSYMFLSGWTCLFSMLQTGIIALFMEKDPKAWVLDSRIEILACLYAGILGTGAKYFIQSWCVSRKGPLFVATFSPLNAVFTTFFASMFFHEELYSGGLLGAVIVIIGLYVFLWAKAREMKENEEVEPLCTTSSGNQTCTVDLEHPLLPNNSCVNVS